MKLLILFFKLRSEYLILKHKCELQFLKFKYELMEEYNKHIK